MNAHANRARTSGAQDGNGELPVIIENVPPYLKAIVDTIAPAEEYGLSDAERRTVIDESTCYLTGQIAAMAPELRIKAWVGLTVFRVYSWVRRGKAFDQLPLHERDGLTDSWSNGSLYGPRQLFRMLRSITLLAYFEHPLVVRALNGELSNGGNERLSGSAVRPSAPTAPTVL